MADKKRYGKYDVVGRLGVGGMGVVYKGYDSLIDRHVAIKTMSLDKAHDDNLKKRFYREAQSAGMLNHPNIVTIYDMDEEDGQPYIAMELLSGIDLKEIISKRSPIPIERKLDIVAQACDALDYAHRHGVVHRDIKPGNIRLLDNGVVKILDFGIARIESSELTKTGMVMGTVSYMSPEQIAGKKVDGRSDVFSMGVLFYELITGRKPFPGEAITTIIYKIMNEAPDALARADSTPLPAPVERIINRALEKDLNKRYTDAGTMASDIRGVLASLQAHESTLPEFSMPQGIGDSGELAPYAPIAPPPIARSRPPATPGLPKVPSMPLMPSRPDSISVTFPPTMGPVPSAPPPPAPSAPPPGRPEATATAANLPRLEPARPAPPRPPVIPPAPPVEPRPRPSVPTARPASLPSLDIQSAEPEAAAKRGPGRGIFLGVAVAAAIVLAFVFLRGDGAAKLPPGFVTVDARPWASIEIIDLSSNAPVSLPVRETPCRVSLPPGKYEVRLRHDRFGSLTEPLSVESGKVHPILRNMPDFKLAPVLDKL